MDSIEDVTKLVGLPYLGAKTQVSTTKSNTKVGAPLTNSYFSLLIGMAHLQPCDAAYTHRHTGTQLNAASNPFSLSLHAQAKSDPRKRTQQKGGDQTKQNASLHHTNVAKTSLMTGSSKGTHIVELFAFHYLPGIMHCLHALCKASCADETHIVTHATPRCLTVARGKRQQPMNHENVCLT